ncbi:Glutamine--fructose-6-phosphate aminotransferase [isomerizing] [Bienertia sinuspersici]
MNATSDMEMMEVAENVTPLPQNDVASGYLALARQYIDQGKPSEALQAVVMAMRTKGGEEAVSYIFQRAGELYRSKLQASAEADELASLFAECAIAEAYPPGSEPSQPSPLPYATSPSVPVPSFSTSTLPNVLAHELESDARGKSILAESGRKQIVLDAFSDGSSFICLQCGGLVSNHRKDEHYAYWCQF